MKMRTAIAAASGAALLGTGAFVLPDALASPTTAATHTVSFISVQSKTITFSGKTSGAVQDSDISKGKTIGLDMIYFALKPPNNVAFNITVDIKGGFLYGTATQSLSTGVISHGKVTGGTGAFKGATGTIKAKSLNKMGTRTAVTITYRT